MKALLLFPLTLILTIVWQIRKLFYRFRKARMLKTPVVSIGNLSFGGTGKTPVVDFLLAHFQKQYKIGVLSRGYGGDAFERPSEVEISKDKFFGDEILWLKKRHPEISMAVFPKRFEAGRMLEEPTKSDPKPYDFFLLDDGFQHWDLHRQLDLVLIDASSGFSDLAFFPVGRGREPIAALNRADGFLLTKVNWASENELRYIVHILKIRFPKIPIYQFTYEMAGIVEANDDSTQTVSFNSEDANALKKSHLSSSAKALVNERWVAISGIAKPKMFEKMLVEIGMSIEMHHHYKDHFNFSLSDVQKIITRTNSMGVKCIITTEKDLVRLSKYLFLFKENGLRIFAVEMVVRPKSDLKGFYEQIIDVLR